MLALVAGAAPAAAQPPIKVAVIDVERILLESNRGKAALGEIENLRKAKQQEGEVLQKEIADLQTRLNEGRLSLAEDKLAELTKQLEDKVIAARRFQDDATRELTKKRDQVLDQIEQSIFPVINQVGREGGYTLIFNKYNSGLVYADESVDITAQVIERYNQTTSGGP
ncbi:MAG TPA: OmpH family outer membrane protein [Thermoanaerobaculia bacterium]|nr:OmpH family outer membrane protein [Thermoanaerobaculia bacterium]